MDHGSYTLTRGNEDFSVAIVTRKQSDGSTTEQMIEVETLTKPPKPKKLTSRRRNIIRKYLHEIIHLPKSEFEGDEWIKELYKRISAPPGRGDMLLLEDVRRWLRGPEFLQAYQYLTEERSGAPPPIIAPVEETPNKRTYRTGGSAGKKKCTGYKPNWLGLHNDHVYVDRTVVELKHKVPQRSNCSPEPNVASKPPSRESTVLIQLPTYPTQNVSHDPDCEQVLVLPPPYKTYQTSRDSENSQAKVSSTFELEIPSPSTEFSQTCNETALRDYTLQEIHRFLNLHEASGLSPQQEQDECSHNIADSGSAGSPYPAEEDAEELLKCVQASYFGTTYNYDPFFDEHQTLDIFHPFK